MIFELIIVILLFTSCVIWLWIVAVTSSVQKREMRLLENIISDYRIPTIDHLLFLDYSQHDYKRIDESLSLDHSRQIIILFRAPPWLIKMKARSWDCHIVIDANGIQCFDYFASKRLLIMKSAKKGYHYVTEVPYYLTK